MPIAPMWYWLARGLDDRNLPFEQHCTNCALITLKVREEGSQDVEGHVLGEQLIEDLELLR